MNRKNNYFNLINWLFPMKEQKFIFSICLCFIPILVFLAYSNSFAKECMLDSTCNVPNLGISFFYKDVQDIGFNLLYAFLLLLLIPSLYSYQTLKEKNNLFNTMIIQRITFRKYIKKEILNNFIKTFVVIMIIYIYTLLITNFFVPIEFNFSAIDLNHIYDPSYQRYYELFSNNSFISTIIYIIHVSFGYAIFSTFVLSLQFYVKNLYIFRILGVITLILFVSINAFITSLLTNLVGVKIATIILSPLMIGFLLNPGIITFGYETSISSVGWYYIVAITFLLISNVLFKLSEKRWLKENV